MIHAYRLRADAWSLAFQYARIAQSVARYALTTTATEGPRWSRLAIRAARRHSSYSQKKLNAAFDALWAEQRSLYGGSSRWSW